MYLVSYPSSNDSLIDGEGEEWLIRYRAIGAKSTDVAVTRKVTVEYTLAAVTAFSKLPRSTEKPFRFVFLSGFIVVRDQKKSVWLFPEARKVGVSSPYYSQLQSRSHC